jgi:Flp pilus assembly protein TadG
MADTRGGVAATFALALPVIVVIAIGAIELSSLSADKSAMQAAADNAALMAAKELSVSSADAVIERSKAFVTAELSGKMPEYKLVADTSVSADPAEVTVELVANRPSFFVNLLPPGGFTIKVRSVAASMGSAPLCVLSHGVDRSLLEVDLKLVKVKAGPNGAGLLLEGNSRMEAPACLVQSNDDLTVNSGARLVAAVARAGGLARGNISPAGESSAPPILDPFSDYDLSVPDPCPKGSPPKLKISGSETLPAGVHCGGIELDEDAIFTLAPGDHYFIGDVKVKKNAQLIGRDVALVFDRNSKFEFKDNSRINLEGRKTGKLAGFVVITTRENTRDFHMDSGRVEQMLGTIYIPEARLIIEGTEKVAEQSDWTVIIAKQVNLKGSPSLVVNANYATSNVPVPVGVGPSAGAQLVR